MMLTRTSKFLIPLFACIALGAALFLFRSQPKYYLSVGAIFRNEARFLPEWIEYHRLHGVEHFYLFNNLSDDDYKTALKPYLEQGLVDLYEWPYQGKNQKEWNKIQCKAYATILKEKKNETFWMAIIDTDEFIVPTQVSNLQTFLKPYEPYGGVVINWQLFGTSDVNRLAPGQTLIGSLIKRAPRDYPVNLFVKSIVQPRKVKKVHEPHYCHYKRPFYHVAENFKRLPSKSVTEEVQIDKIKIHHYTYRDETFFRTEKQKRYAEWHPEAPPIQVHPAYNEVEDTSLLSDAKEVEGRLNSHGNVVVVPALR